MTLIAAEELGLDMSEMKLVQSDTSLTPFDSGTYGSRVTFLTGNATRNAAVDAKRKLLKCIGEKWNVDPHTLECIDHTVASKENQELKMAIGEACSYYMQTHNGGELTGVGSYFHDVDPKLYHGDHNGNFAPSYSFSTGACHVTVDEETGVIDISDFVFAADCGRPLNMRAAEGQLEGSIQMGLGYALYEQCIVENGKIKNPSFRDYRFPTAVDMPKMKTIFCGPDDPDGPFGAKEVGEGSTAPVAPTIVNAVNKATGLHITEIPITPEKIWRALKEKNGKK
jgi:CO/xanthine dehydrogenase Mo-binding subunit